MRIFARPKKTHEPRRGCSSNIFWHKKTQQNKLCTISLFLSVYILNEKIHNVVFFFGVYYKFLLAILQETSIDIVQQDEKKCRILILTAAKEICDKNDSQLFLSVWISLLTTNQHSQLGSHLVDVGWLGLTWIKKWKMLRTMHFTHFIFWIKVCVVLRKFRISNLSLQFDIKCSQNGGVQPLSSKRLRQWK